jgi:heme-degrading monooxygenase HmoA
MSYVVIFTSQKTGADSEGYEKMAEAMDRLAEKQKGFLGLQWCRDANGFGMSVSRWESLEDIASWRQNSQHMLAQEFGRQKWYSSFSTIVAKVERESKS